MKIINLLILCMSIHFQAHSYTISGFSYHKENFPISSTSAVSLNENDDVLIKGDPYYGYAIWYKDGRIQKLDDSAWWHQLGNSGMAIGYLYASKTPIYWTQNSNIQKLEIEKDIADVEEITLVDINGADQIIGNYKSQDIHKAFLWQNGQTKDLAIDMSQAAIQLGFDIGSVIVVAINEQGTILGYFQDTQSLVIYNFLWDGQNLDIIDIPKIRSVVDLNNNNQVLATSSEIMGFGRTVIWSKNEGLIDLGQLFIPSKMNDKAEILAISLKHDLYRWGVQNGGGFFQLPAYSGRFPKPARDINNNGVVTAEFDGHAVRLVPYCWEHTPADWELE